MIIKMVLLMMMLLLLLPLMIIMMIMMMVLMLMMMTMTMKGMIIVMDDNVGVREAFSADHSVDKSARGARVCVGD